MLTAHASDFDAVVIGGGPNGLVAAAYLARGGLRVALVERRPSLGGGAVTEEVLPGHRVDLLAHRVPPIAARVLRELDLARHGLEWVDPDPTVFAPALDGPPLLLWRGASQAAEAIRRISAADAARWPSFVERLSGLARALEAAWASVPPEVPPGGLASKLRLLLFLARLRLSAGRSVSTLLRALPMAVDDFLAEWFESPALRGALAAEALVGMPLGPRAPGTALALIEAHLGSPKGVVRPVRLVRGGVGALAGALAGTARSLGAELRVANEVREILLQAGRAAGVALADGSVLWSRRVVSCVDPKTTFLRLLPPGALAPSFTRAVRNLRARGVTAKLNLVVAGLPEFSCLPGEGAHLAGVISISPSTDYLERAHDDSKYGATSTHPTLELVIPSLHDPSLCPPGRHVVSVLVQYAPHGLRDAAWDDAQREALADRAIALLSEYAPNLPGLVLGRQVITPADLEREYGFPGGSIHHSDPTLDQRFVMRPVPGWGGYRTPVPGLYLGGAGAHPGGGLTGIPGKNAARQVLRDMRRRE